MAVHRLEPTGHGDARRGAGGRSSNGLFDARRPPARPVTAADPAVVSHGHGAAIVSTQDELLAAALPFLDDGPARRRPGRAHLPAGHGRPPLPRARRAGRAPSSPSRGSACSVPGRPTRSRCAAGTSSGPSPRAGRRLGAAARRGRGRLRRRPRRLAGGPALRVGLQPAARRGPRLRDLPLRPAPAPRARGRQRRRHPSAAGRAAPPGRPAPASRTRASTCPRSRCPGPPSRTATRSSPSRTPRRWPACGTSSGAVLATLVPDRDQQEDLHLAASEIAANAFRHGVRPVSARVWADGGLRRLRHQRPGHVLPRPVQRLRPGARARPLPRRHGPVAGPQALGPRRRAAHRRGPLRPAEHAPALTSSA